MLLSIIVKCQGNFTFNVYLDHMLLGCFYQGDPLIHLEVKRLAFIKMDKTPWIAYGLSSA